MLGKLIAYEFRSSKRLMPLVLLAAVAMCIAGLLLMRVDHYFHNMMAFLVLLAAGLAAAIITYIIVFVRFYRGMYGAEGYLAMTLPASSTQVYLSKVIMALIWLFLASIITLAASLMSVYAMFRSTIFLQMQTDGIAYEAAWNLMLGDGMIAAEMSRLFSPGFIVFAVISGLFGYMAFTAEVFFCVTVANIKPFQNMGIAAAILAYIALYTIDSIIGGTLTFLLPLGIKFVPGSGWSFVTQNMLSTLFNPNLESVTIGIGTLLLPIVWTIVLPIVTIKLMNRKVNLK